MQKTGTFLFGVSVGVALVVVIDAFAPGFLIEFVPAGFFGLFLVSVIGRLVVEAIERKEARKR